MFRLSRFCRILLLSVIAFATEPLVAAQDSVPAATCTCHDRLVLVSTRHLTSDVCRAQVKCPDLRFWRCDTGDPISLASYEAGLSPGRPVIIYVHGNRMPAADLMNRFNAIRQSLRPRIRGDGVDWLIFSWPSDKAMKGIEDFRLKANRCDAQGLYLAWLLRRHVERAIPVTVLGYSFGARVATGALHSLGGGDLGGRCLPGASISNADVRVALVAPAIESSWLSSKGYHRFASRNMDRLLLLFNPRDAVLKRYWLIAGQRGRKALGITGLTSLALGAGGKRVPVRSKNLTPCVGIRHTELGYYSGAGNAANDVAWLINGFR